MKTRAARLRLDESGPVGLTEAMGRPSLGKSSSKGRSTAAHRDGGDDETARGRLLNAATRLFCKNGINATGIDAIINEAGTAKTTLYKLFGSKNNLVHARGCSSIRTICRASSSRCRLR